MHKWIAILAIATMALPVVAAPKVRKLSQTERMRVIMGAMNSRIVDQEDFWFEKGEFPKAVQTLRVHNLLMPNDYEVATNLGWMLENVDLWNEALATYIRYRNMNPQDPDAAFPEANFYFMKKAFAKVPVLLEPAIVKKPHPNSYRILAHAYDRLKMYGDSKRVWQLYLKRFPDDGAAKQNLKRVSDKLSKAAKA